MPERTICQCHAVRLSCPINRLFSRTMPINRRYSILLIFMICAVSRISADDKLKRHFTARQAFDYQGPILFNSNFTDQGLDKFNLSEDGRYGIQKHDPTRTQITTAPELGVQRKVVRFTVPRAANSYRSEISLPSERGFNERWYGISMLVPKDWKFDTRQGADIVIQWHAIPGNWKPTYPNLAIAIQDSNWFVRQSFGSPQKSPTRRKTKLDEPMRPGVWTAWIIHAKWSPDGNGQIRIWNNGKPVFNHKGPNVYGTIGKEYTPYLKTGIYHPEWNLKSEQHKLRFQAEMPGVLKKEIYVSDVVIGNSDATYDLIARRLEDHALKNNAKRGGTAAR